jgi:gamma-glutamyltranspeptidase/glutathione hydrolase
MTFDPAGTARPMLPFDTSFGEPQRPTFMARRYTVVANHPAATRAGIRVLEAGGNAIDAGIAAGLVLNVVESEMCHFLGVAPAMVYTPKTGKVISVVGPGPWPMKATLDYFHKHHDGMVPRGVLQAVVPSAPDTWFSLLAQYGTMSFGEVAAEAIDLAENGFPMYPLRRMRTLEMLKPGGIHYRCDATDAVFVPGGAVPEVGQIFRQPAMADMFRYIVDQEKAAAKKGRLAGIAAARAAVYEGDVARAIIRLQEAEGGLMTMADLAAFRVEHETPLTTRFGGMKVFASGAWGQGPMLLQTLNMLKRFDLKAMGHNSADYVHVLAETLKLAAADREHYFGDPRVVDVPLDELLSPDYALRRSAEVALDRAAPEMPRPGRLASHRYPADWAPDPTTGIKPARGDQTPAETSYLCVVDAEGNVFSCTPSDAGVMGPVVPELGLPCCCWGSRAYTAPDHPARLGPGARPRMAANPQIAISEDGDLVMPFGSPGSEVLGQAQIEAFLNMVVFRMEPQLAVEAPRFASYSWPGSMIPHKYFPALLQLEGRFDKATADALAARGHKIGWWGERSWRAGSVSAILQDRRNGILYAGADHRRTAYAAGW